MTITVTLILLYLVLGAWLFVSAVTSMGGIANIPEYNKRSIAIMAFLIVMIFWPVIIAITLYNRRR